ncbi:hypothetical protein C8A03DRAFT_19939, partial [Achaetomium macrosporum]
DDDDDDAAEPGDDIVTETVKTWNVCRTRNRRRASRGQDRPQAYNLEAFVVKWVESDNRTRQLGDILMDDRVREALRAQGISIRYMADDVEDPAIKIRREMETLLKEPQFADFVPHHGLAPAPAPASAPASAPAPLENTLTQMWPTLKTKAPTMVTFFSRALQNQFKTVDAVQETTVDEERSNQICLLASLLMTGYARNSSMFVRQVLGLYMLANGTARRVIETMSRLGITTSYTVLNDILNDMEKKARSNFQRAAHDPNSVVVYDNFNFKNRIRELAGGRQDQFVNLTTACLVCCPELNGPLKQSSFDLTQRFTVDMAIDYLMPRRVTVDRASRWLMGHAFMQVFAKEGQKGPEYPVVNAVKYEDSPYLPIGAIFEDEGKIDGVYKLHEELWQRRLKFTEYDERLTLVYGDQKTTSSARRIQRSQLEASEPWEQKKWMLLVPAFFHIELNYIEMLFRMFWDTGNKSLSSATISADVQFFKRGRHISKKDIKYHQVLPLLIHGYTARVTAFVIQHLVGTGELSGDLDVDSVKQAMQGLSSQTRADILMSIWTEILLILHEAVRRGDFGLIGDIIPILPLLFWGGKSSNYGPEMLYFAWLLHPAVSKDENARDAILKGGLVRCTTAGSGYKAIDLMLEHINATYALDIKNHKNSTHDIHTTFSRLALNGNYLATIRKSVESAFGRHQKGTHTAGDPTTDIISYACKLYKDGMPKRSVRPGPQTEAFDAPDIFERGQTVLLAKLPDFNDVVPYPKDAADQRALPGVVDGDMEDGDLVWEDEGDRLFDVDDDDPWRAGLGDLGMAS